MIDTICLDIHDLKPFMLLKYNLIVNNNEKIVLFVY
jgi:hypothetical protein